MDPENLSKVGGGGSFGLRVFEIQPGINPRTTLIGPVYIVTSIDKEEGLRPIFGHYTNEFR